MDKQRVAVIGPGSWGTALSQVLNDNGHEVRIWGNIAEQIDEINQAHTNTRYFKDTVLDEKIKAYHSLAEALDGSSGAGWSRAGRRRSKRSRTPKRLTTGS